MMMMVQVVNKAMYNNNINKVLMESGQYFIFLKFIFAWDMHLHPLYDQYFDNMKRPTPSRLWQRPISKYDDEKE